jgi:hypothetical protein
MTTFASVFLNSYTITKVNNFKLGFPRILVLLWISSCKKETTSTDTLALRASCIKNLMFVITARDLRRAPPRIQASRLLP